MAPSGDSEDVKKENWLKRIIKSSGPKTLIFLLIIALLFAIIDVSDNITPATSRPTIDATDIIEVNDDNIVLYVLSLSLLILITMLFTRIIFFNQKEEFGIESYKSWKAYWFLLLIMIFLFCVMILLDVALVNIYLSLPAVTAIWQLNDIFDLSDSIPTGTDFLAYSNIRGKIFAGLFIFLMSFPVLMFFVILTRVGRSRLFNKNEINIAFYFRLFKTFSSIIIGLSLLFIVYIGSIYPSSFVRFSGIVAALAVGTIILFTIFLLIIDIMRRIFKFTSINLLILFPIIFLFYVLPVMAWSAFDILIVDTDGDLVKTIYNEHPLEEDVKNDIQKLFINTLILNAVAIERILELDFVLIIGISSLIIGFAEGYALLSIGRALFKGKTVLRSGKLARGSASSSPGMIRTTRSFMLLAWFGMLWDKAFEIIVLFVEEYDIPLNVTEFPKIFDLAYGLSYEVLAENNVLLPLVILILPAIIIINSSFKFLSVSLVIDKTEDDTQAFFLLISSTFVLIVTKIFVDITSISIFQESFKPALPFQSLATSDFLIFAVNVFMNLEALAFYAGVLAVLIYGIPRVLLGKENS